MPKITLNHSKNEIARFSLQECLDLFKTLTDPDSKVTITSRDFEPQMPQSVLKWKAGGFLLSVGIATAFILAGNEKGEGEEQDLLKSAGKGFGICLITVLCN